MRKLLLMVLFFPIALSAQKLSPRFENDTLHTSCGYKIFNGQTLHFAKGSHVDEKFRFVKIVGPGNEKLALTNNSVLVNKLSRYNITGLGNVFILVHGTITKNGNAKKIKFNLAFDRAIENFAGFPSELVVPEEFRISFKGSLSEEINGLYQLYKDSIISKEEFEKQKKKLLRNN